MDKYFRSGKGVHPVSWGQLDSYLMEK